MYQVVRRWLIAVFQLVIFGNGYIALCAVVMCQTTVKLFHLHIPGPFLPFMFAGTLGSYCLHVCLTDTSVATVSAGHSDRERWIDAHKPGLFGVFIVSMLIGGWLLMQLDAYLTDLLPVVVLTFLYTAPKINWGPFRALRRIAILKTAYLTLVWTYATVVLPILLATPGGRINWALAGVWMLNRFLLIYSIALCFDYRDREVDRQSNWLTIVSRLSGRQAQLFLGILAACFGLTVAALFGLGWDGWTLFCVCLPMIILLLVARGIVRRASEYGYYVYLDGLLMLTGLLLNFLP